MTQTNSEVTGCDFIKYPTLESLQQNLREFKKIDLSKATQEDIERTFFSFLEILPSLIGKYSAEKFNKFRFYRVRLNIDTDKEDLNLVQTYSYPLPIFCRENGRANLKNKSVFYCSNCPITAILESKPKVGEIGYLSIWEGRAIKEMKAGILLPRDLKRENVWHVLSDDVYPFVDDALSTKMKDKMLLFQETLKFVSTLFLEERPPYPVTSWIANELIYGTAWKDLIIYPSFVNKSNSSNIVIHPNVVDNHLQFVKVIRFKVLEIKGDTFSISTGRVGEIINTNIKWRVADRHEIDFSQFP
jgi:hypothetical protein